MLLGIITEDFKFKYASISNKQVVKTTLLSALGLHCYDKLTVCDRSCIYTQCAII